MYFSVTLLVVAWCLPVLKSSSVSTEERPVVSTNLGLVRGVRGLTVGDQQFEAFLGIPYAESPVGNGRFKTPTPKGVWSGELDAGNFSSSCYQYYNRIFEAFKITKYFLPFTERSEDCLSLNIWRPGHLGDKKPVMVFIHGGGFSAGSSATPVYVGDVLSVTQDVIVVSINYRVASFGFLFLDNPDAPGNVGLHDQHLALRWIQDNIGHFGGDPDEVTIFGQSAGGASVFFHMVSPLSIKMDKPLFKRVIMESAAPAIWNVLSKEESLSKAGEFVVNLGCPFGKNATEETIQCLLKATAQEIIEAEPIKGYLDFLVFLPVVDGHFIVEEPKVSFEEGRYVKAEVMVGSNRNEGGYFLMALMPYVYSYRGNVVIDKDAFDETVKNIVTFANDITRKAIAYEYNDWYVSNATNKNYLFNAEMMVTDFHFTCPIKELSSSLLLRKDAKVFRYFFTHRSSNSLLPKWFGTFHGEEMFFTFGHPLTESNGYTQEEQQLSRRIMQYFGNFARTGNPNGDDLVPWPPLNQYGDGTLILSPNSTTVLSGAFKSKKCAFWRYLVPKLNRLSEKANEV